MAPQTSTPIAATILGTIGTVLWCVQLLPQIWYNWRTKKTEGLPSLMMFLFALCAVPFGVYAIVQNFNVPIQIQPQIFGCLSLVSWAQILIYTNGWKIWKALLLALGVAIIFGGVEALLILTIRGPYENSLEWPILVVGIVAAIILVIALLPPYYEAWKRRGRVIGINWVFLSIDWLGGLFSLMALSKSSHRKPQPKESLTAPTVAQNTFDILGGILFILVIILEGGIFLTHIVWLLRTRRLRRRAKLDGIRFDEMPEARKYQPRQSASSSIINSPVLDEERFEMAPRSAGTDGTEKSVVVEQSSGTEGV